MDLRKEGGGGRKAPHARLSSIIAKELLNGQKVVMVVRCEEICISGGLVCQKMKYMHEIPP